jgi:phosphatidylserine/phosphatidylglycerophosphate/cardiolipin synthase-like enzyme
VKRVYTSDYDYNRPFDTVSWTIQDEQRAEDFLKSGGPSKPPFEKHIAELISEETAGEGEFRLVLSLPLNMHRRRGEILNTYNAVDFFDAYREVIESAEKEIKIMSPFIDAYSLYPIVDKLSKESFLSVHILTEKDNLAREFDLVHLLTVMREGGLNIKVRDAKLVANSEVMEDVKEILGREYKNYKISGIHAKLIIADTSVALAGSFNFTRFHYLSNFDIGFLIYDRYVVRTLSNLFKEMWKNGRPIFREAF